MAFLIFSILSFFLHFANSQTISGPLFLTPLINSGRIDEAQNFSRVTGLDTDIISHSGFITVNDDFNSNMFFWFFPAAENASTAQVWLWSEGGPGITMLHSLFTGNGPFIMDGENNLTPRNKSWHLTQNIIFLDNPVGVGYSFTENEAGNIDSAESASKDIYNFIVQFLKMFPDLQGNDFYNGGVSYGASYALHVAALIHDMNQGTPDLKVNLKGILLESPWIDSTTQLDYGEYLKNVGIISEKAKIEVFDRKRDIVLDLIARENYTGAMGEWRTFVGVDIPGVCGYSPLYHIVKDELTFYNFTDFITSPETREALHVGSNTSFCWVCGPVQANMGNNFMKSAKASLDKLLSTEEYRILVNVGNLDVTTGHLGIASLLNSLNWEGKDELLNSERGIWRVDNRIAGYVQTARNFTNVLMRNAGHGTNGDQPDWGFDLVNRFTRGESFADQASKSKILPKTELPPLERAVSSGQNPFKCLLNLFQFSSILVLMLFLI